MKLIYTYLIYSLLTACDAQLGETNKEKETGVDHSENVMLEGISSGGGGTILANPASKEEVSQTISQVKRDMHLFLNYMSFSNVDNLESLNENIITIKNFKVFDWYSLFIANIEKTRSIIESTKITDSINTPCFFQGRETDGSFLPAEGICLSSMSLQTKLNQIDYYPQLLALAVHEYAHALGANEELAQRIQRDTLNLFTDSSASGVQNLIDENAEALKSMFLSLDSIPREKGTYVFNDISRLKLQIPSSPLCFLSFAETHFLTDFYAQATNTLISVNAIDGHHEFLDKLYGEEESVSCIKIFEQHIIPPGGNFDYTFKPTENCTTQRLVSPQGDSSKYYTDKILTESYNKILDLWVGGENIKHPECDPDSDIVHSIWDEESQEWVIVDDRPIPECDVLGRTVLNRDIIIQPTE